MTVSGEAWKGAHDALKRYHAVRGVGPEAVAARVAAWDEYLAALTVAQAADRYTRKVPAR